MYRMLHICKSHITFLRMSWMTGSCMSGFCFFVCNSFSDMSRNLFFVCALLVLAASSALAEQAAPSDSVGTAATAFAADAQTRGKLTRPSAGRVVPDGEYCGSISLLSIYTAYVKLKVEGSVSFGFRIDGSMVPSALHHFCSHIRFSLLSLSLSLSLSPPPPLSSTCTQFIV